MSKFFKMLAAILITVCGVWAQDITISTVAELITFRDAVSAGDNFLGRTVSLLNSIDLNGCEENQWVPIGTIANSGARRSFRGTFDGGGFVISGIYISAYNRPNVWDAYEQGFFSHIAEEGIVKNLGIIVNIRGGDFVVGGLVAQNYGIIENSYVKGIVEGKGDVGGLAGRNYGTIRKSFASVNVRGSRFDAPQGGGTAGGLAGLFFGGIIENSYATGDVRGIDDNATFVGGLVGLEGFDGIIENSYATGLVQGNNSAGQLAGMFNSGTITNSYALRWGRALVGFTANAIISNSALKTTEEMQSLQTFNNWDFTDIWGINPHINNGFPHLLGLNYDISDCDFEWVETTAPTCVVNGEETKTCTICGKTDGIRSIGKLEHISSEAATCTTPQICTREWCEHIIVEAIGHLWDNWGSWTIINQTSCDKEGSRERIAECRRMFCGIDTTEIRIIPQLTEMDGCAPSSIRPQQNTDTRYGIILENAVVSDFARISVVTPEPATMNLAIFDNLGNVVFAVGADPRVCPNINADQNGQTQGSAPTTTVVWDLTNNNGRFVTNGTYLIIVEAKGISGKKYTYSTRIGVRR